MEHKKQKNNPRQINLMQYKDTGTAGLAVLPEAQDKNDMFTRAFNLDGEEKYLINPEVKP